MSKLRPRETSSTSVFKYIWVLSSLTEDSMTLVEWDSYDLTLDNSPTSSWFSYTWTWSMTLFVVVSERESNSYSQKYVLHGDKLLHSPVVIGTYSPSSSRFLQSRSMTKVWLESPCSFWIWEELVVSSTESLLPSIVLTCGTKSFGSLNNLERSKGIG